MNKILALNLKMDCNKKIIHFVNNFLSELTNENLQIFVAIPFPYLIYAKEIIEKNTNHKIISQDVSAYESGAHTGEVSAQMLKDLKIHGTIIGHSERRLSGDTENTLDKKIKYAIQNDLFIIYCIGESEENRKQGKTFSILENQLKLIANFIEKENIIIAYEPIWSIGTGKIPTNEQIKEISVFIKEKIFTNVKNIKILYGGSVNKENSKNLSEIEKIDGFLVGGCSTKKEIVDIGKNLSKN